MKKETSRFGFREDFDWDTRLDLKTEAGKYIVSTVDLGIDHSFGIGKPLYYETMIFRKDGDKIDFSELYCDRYSTEEEAREGHKRAIKIANEYIEGAKQ